MAIRFPQSVRHAHLPLSAIALILGIRASLKQYVVIRDSFGEIVRRFGPPFGAPIYDARDAAQHRLPVAYLVIFRIGRDQW
jgi:hypothetical protein